MKLLLTLFICFCTSIAFSQANKLTIKGKIERLPGSDSRHILLIGRTETVIDQDGSFILSDTISAPEFTSIKTDISFSDGIWLEPGNYNVSLKEVKLPNDSKGVYLRISLLNGPEDAEILNKFIQTRRLFAGNEESRKSFELNYIDSIIKVKPQAICIVQMLRSVERNIGIEKIESLLLKIPDSDYKKDYIASLEMKKARNRKIETEKYFVDFSMAKPDGKTFNLSKVKAKVVLIDFWSSDCPPCRSRHSYLGSLYGKFHKAGLEIVSVSLDRYRKDWIKAIAKDKMNWVNVSELKGWETSLAKSYHIEAIPFHFWLNANKKIISKEINEKELEELLNK